MLKLNFELFGEIYSCHTDARGIRTNSQLLRSWTAPKLNSLKQRKSIKKQLYQNYSY